MAGIKKTLTTRFIAVVTDSKGELEFHRKIWKSVYWEVKRDTFSRPEQGQKVASSRQALT